MCKAFSRGAQKGAIGTAGQIELLEMARAPSKTVASHAHSNRVGAEGDYTSSEVWTFADLGKASATE